MINMDAECLSKFVAKEKIYSTLDFIRMRSLENSKQFDGRQLHRSLKIPFLKIELPKINLKKALKEADSVSDLFVEHRSKDSSGWSSLCIHGIDSFKTRHCEFYGFENELATPYQWTEVSQRCPLTTSWVKSLMTENYFEKLYRVRFMKLKAGGHINFHWDRPPGQNSLGPINFAVNMPTQCHWLFEEWGRVPFAPGNAFAVDVSNHHGVWNQSQEDRIHIIIHGRYGQSYYDAISTAHNKNLEKIKSGEFYE